MPVDRRQARWQGTTLSTLFVGYVGYYLCRSNLSISMPLLEADLAADGVTKEHLGALATVGLLAYGCGKFTIGPLTEYLGGRAVFLAGMLASALCCALFGLAGGLTLLIALWGLNRYAQSVGWVALVKVASRWFSIRRQATVMGILSLSFLLGDAVARLYLGSFVGLGWRGVFLVSAGSLAVLALVPLVWLRNSPRDVGLEEPAANPANVFGTLGDEARPESLRQLLVPLLSSVPFLLVCVVNAGLTLTRETLNLWTPTFLTSEAGYSPATAARMSTLVPLAGAAAALLAGMLSDLMGGRHGRVVAPGVLCLAGTLAALSLVPPREYPLTALALICGSMFFLIAPYTFLAGAIALELGGKRGSSTASGLVDSVGYAVAAVFSGYGVGAIVERLGWTAAFWTLTAVASATAVAACVYLFHQERVRAARETV